MKSLSLLISLFVFTTNIIAQTSRGVSVTQSSQQEESKYRMLVIGISKYKNIQPLQYADKDALMFYNFMRKSYKNHFNDRNSKLLINETATASGIFSEGLEWLVQEAEKGETIIIYFSGHGDVENTTINNHGFLLAYDSPKSVYMSGGSIGIEYLQSYINTLVEKKGVKVILIADACRSGKLAGGTKGAATTSVALQQQWENVTKIMSSQPGEVSYEDLRWNGGGGVFTNYLIKGMLGYADRNKDGKVTVYELDAYLYDQVSIDTKNSQTPFIMGNKSDVISFVNDSLLIVYQDFLKNQTSSNEMNTVSSRGVEDEIADPNLKDVYKNFHRCLADRHLVRVDTLNNRLSAYDYYLEIESIDKGGFWDRSARRKLISVLTNRYTEALNLLIEGESNSPWLKSYSDSYEIRLINKQLQVLVELINPESPYYDLVKEYCLISYLISGQYGIDEKYLVVPIGELKDYRDYYTSNADTDTLWFINKSRLVDSCLKIYNNNPLFHLLKAVTCENGLSLFATGKIWSYSFICYDSISIRKALQLCPNFNLIHYINLEHYNFIYELCFENFAKNDLIELEINIQDSMKFLNNAIEAGYMFGLPYKNINSFYNIHSDMISNIYKKKDTLAFKNYFEGLDSMAIIEYNNFNNLSLLYLMLIYDSWKFEFDTLGINIDVPSKKTLLLQKADEIEEKITDKCFFKDTLEYLYHQINYFSTKHWILNDINEYLVNLKLIPIYEKICSINPTTNDYQSLADCYISIGEVEKGVDTYEKLFKTKSRSLFLGGYSCLLIHHKRFMDLQEKYGYYLVDADEKIANDSFCSQIFNNVRIKSLKRIFNFPIINIKIPK